MISYQKMNIAVQNFLPPVDELQLEQNTSVQDINIINNTKISKMALISVGFGRLDQPQAGT